MLLPATQGSQEELQITGDEMAQSHLCLPEVIEPQVQMNSRELRRS